MSTDDKAATEWKAELERLKQLFREARARNDGSYYGAYAILLKHTEWKQDKWQIFS